MGLRTGHLLAQVLSVFCVAALAVLSLPMIGTSAVAAAPSAEPAPQKTRFIVGLDRRAEYHIISLAKPNRVVIELGKARLQLPAQPSSGPIGLVAGFQAGSAGTDKNRIVINVTEPVVVQKSEIVAAGENFHLNLEIVSVAEKKPVRDLKDAPFDPPSGLGAVGIPVPRAIDSVSQFEERRAKPVIVLDPGHGGHDSGAKKNGAVEKDVVLAFAHTLREKLEASGRYRVLMTRDKDEFIPLTERRAFAERNKAQLFIAIHADYARSSASGAAVFSLRDSVAKKLKKSAMRKAGRVDVADKVAAIESSDRNIVENWLSDLARQDVAATSDRSDLFSRSVIRHMGSKTQFRSQPHRSAAFKVLKTHLVPSVLIELAFVTNKEDARRLKSESWRSKVSDGIATAVDNYFSHQTARMPIMAAEVN